MLSLAIICGGLTKERGISLNSARSFFDHISPLGISTTILYVNEQGSFYELTPSQLYSNTPADFDFKLAREKSSLSELELLSLLKKVDLTFPLIHGPFGEDGKLQFFLEKNKIPFVGSKSKTCEFVFHKNEVLKQLTSFGFETLPSLYLSQEITQIKPFWEKHCSTGGIVKPCLSGSSIGVFYVTSLEEAKEAISKLQSEGFKEILLQPYCDEVEFTICVLETCEGQAAALLPLEIDIEKKQGSILDFRKKYLPTTDTRYYCPPRFDSKLSEFIQLQSEKLFSLLELRDFARLDGWVTKEGTILFSDFNIISGMEQNSFLFQQASKVGLSHTEVIHYILQTALNRCDKKELLPALSKNIAAKEPIHVIMGGSSAERQVSVMSGTNAWLKLKKHSSYNPTLFLLNKEMQVWKLSYPYALHHTVEEIEEHCQRPLSPDYLELIDRTRIKLNLSSKLTYEPPIRMDFSEFLTLSKKEKAFVFLGLHGGAGEDGTLQKTLEQEQISFNGSNSECSAICMDKKKTAEKIKALHDPDILPMPQISFHIDASMQSDLLWDEAVKTFRTSDLLIKPQNDGCSSGVTRLASKKELTTYLDCVKKQLTHIPLETFHYQQGIVEMPVEAHLFLLEPFIHTDKIHVFENELHYKKISGLCEMTIGIFEKEGEYTAFPPSITVAEKEVLSVEEKFQGGTGINLTPPPEEILSSAVLKKVQERACIAAKALGIENYARLDLFVELETGKIRVIEANTLPALTPSTVLFHQALEFSISPKELLVNITESAKTKTSFFQLT